MSYELSKELRDLNRALSGVTKMLDGIDYEPFGDDRVDDELTKAYQSIFAAGDAINKARHYVINSYGKETPNK